LKGHGRNVSVEPWRPDRSPIKFIAVISVLPVGSLLVININFYRINNILSKLAELFNQTSSDRNCSSSGRDDLAQHQIG